MRKINNKNKKILIFKKDRKLFKVQISCFYPKKIQNKKANDFKADICSIPIFSVNVYNL